MALRQFRRVVGILGVAALVFSGCGDGDDGSADSGDEAGGGTTTAPPLTEENASGLPVERIDDIAVGLDNCADAEAFGAEGVVAPDNVDTFINLVDNLVCQDDLTIASGEAVLFVSNGNNDHFIKSGTPGADTDEFTSGRLLGAQSFVQSFSEPGTFTYFCSIHADSMAGTITVT